MQVEMPHVAETDAPSDGKRPRPRSSGSAVLAPGHPDPAFCSRATAQVSVEYFPFLYCSGYLTATVYRVSLLHVKRPAEHITISHLIFVRTL